MRVGNVFGCSHAYGHGLSDCYDPDTGWPALSPSKQAWPSLLRELGLYDVSYNHSKVGASSDDVLKQILSVESYIFDKRYGEGDIYIALWPTYTRRSVLNKDKQLETYRIQDESTECKEFYKITHTNELKYNYYKNILTANLYLQDVEFYNFFVDLEDMDDHFEFCPTLADFQHRFSRIDFQYILNKHDKALDNVHLGIDGHVELAKRINTFINS